METNAVIVTMDDWEGVYVDGILYDEGHELGGEGGPEERLLYVPQLMIEFDLSIYDVSICYIDDDETIKMSGSLPKKLEDLNLPHDML